MAALPFENTAALPPTASLPRSFVSAEMLFVTLGPSARLIVTDVSDAAVTSPRSKLKRVSRAVGLDELHVRVDGAHEPL